MTRTAHSSDPLRPHAHDPNPSPPGDDLAFVLVAPGGAQSVVTVDDLRQLPQITLPNCFIVSTGHGTSGPFVFGGPTLLSLVQTRLAPDADWLEVEVVSGDGFGNRVSAAELRRPQPENRPIVLAISLAGQPLTRRQGLVRMIVPAETDDALRQVKWVSRVVVNATLARRAQG